MTRHIRAVWVVAALVVACALAGCGSGSGTSSSAGSSAAGSSKTKPSAEFPSSKADAKFVKFGVEASASERAAANAVLEANFKARAAADFEAQCATLDQRTVREVTGSVQNPAASACSRGLSKLAEPLSGTKKVRANTLGEPIAALRVKGNRAWALFHGNNGKDYAILMNRESGIWKVGALLATEL